MTLRIVLWNIHQLDEPWRSLASDASLDIALLQEAKPPPVGVTNDVVPGRDENWVMPGNVRTFRTAVAGLSDRVVMRPLMTTELSSSNQHKMGISRGGTLTVVDIQCGNEVFTCISAYVVWQNVISAQRPRQTVRPGNAGRGGMEDAITP